MAYFSHIIQPFVTVTASGNTHTIDLDKSGNNYKITLNNATNTIAFSNLDATRIGKAGTITLKNPSSVGSLGFQGLQGVVSTPGSSFINFDTTAGATAVITYIVIASDEILINYVGAFGQYPQP